MAIDLLIILGGVLLLAFSRQIAETANKFDPFPSVKVAWFPRINAIILGLVLIIGGSLHLANEFGPR